MNTSRLKKLQSAISNPVLIKKKENLRYLTGQVFENRAEEYLLVLPLTPTLSRRGRGSFAIAFGSGLEKIDWLKKSDELRNIASYLPSNSKLKIEYGFTFGEGKYLKYLLKEKKIKFHPERSVVDSIRQIKEPGEIALIKRSMQIVQRVFGEVKQQLRKKAWTEVSLAQFIEKRGRSLGAEDVSFPAIVASGANAAIPHHVPSNKRLRTGEPIIIDFGFKNKNYCSDFTRTVFLKSAPKKMAEAYNQVEKAYNESIITASVGTDAGKIYQKSVDILAQKKLDKYFIHSLGHGTGLEIHELPNLSPKSRDILENGMVFSIEPGVYIPKIGGVRIEDLVYLEGGKCKKFVNIPTTLIANII